MKTNNDTELIEAKIRLRINSLPDKKEIKVLEAFGGEGLLWKAVERRKSNISFQILSIDKNKYNRIQLIGENTKWLQSLNLGYFDVVDLDAWGSPVKQLEILFDKNYSGIVHCTFIQSMTGNIPAIVLKANGYTSAMLAKVQTIFTTNGLEKFLNYLNYRAGIKQVEIISRNRKNYLWFYLNA